MLAAKLPKEGCPVPPTRGLELPVPSILVIPEHDWRLLAARLVPKKPASHLNARFSRRRAHPFLAAPWLAVFPGL